VPTTAWVARAKQIFQQSRRIEVTADAPTASSDGGPVVLRRLDDELGLTAAVAAPLGGSASVRSRSATKTATTPTCSATTRYRRSSAARPIPRRLSSQPTATGAAMVVLDIDGTDDSTHGQPQLDRPGNGGSVVGFLRGVSPLTLTARSPSKLLMSGDERTTLIWAHHRRARRRLLRARHRAQRVAGPARGRYDVRRHR
jgi:hypothetical protein